jgi:hypothetical protein
MALPNNRLKNTGATFAGKLKPSVSAPLGNGQIEARTYVEEPKDEAHQNTVQVVAGTEIVGDDAPRGIDLDGSHGSGTLMIDAHSYDEFETDFRAHHQTNGARRRGPYEHYRLIYRYGYDLGTDTRYHSAAWASVEQDARPRWEERNPGTWEEFKETIRYAWNKAREQRGDDLRKGH